MRPFWRENKILDIHPGSSSPERIRRDPVDGGSHSGVFVAIELHITDMERDDVISGCGISSRCSDCFAYQ